MKSIKKQLSKILFGFLIVLPFSSVVAQKSMPLPTVQYLKGSIVTSNHDTIYCYVKERDLRETPNVLYKMKLTDQKDLKLKKDDYLRVQIGRTVYEKLTVTDSTSLGDGYLRSDRILKLVCNGYVKLYADINHHGGNPMYGDYESFHITRGNGSLIKINRIGFKSKLKAELGDMPESSTKIEDNEFNFKDIPEFVNSYNLWYLNR